MRPLTVAVLIVLALLAAAAVIGLLGWLDLAHTLGQLD